MVVLTVPAARGASHGRKNLPSRTATAKQLNMLVSFVSGEVHEEDIPSESCFVAVLIPPSPRPSMVIMCTSLYRCCTGSFCSSKVSQETISLGRGTILKEFGTVFPNFVCHEPCSMFSCHLDSDGCLYSIMILLEVCLLSPPFGRGTVRYG
jgi:hypothetical protein